jgi:glutathione S-transferase
MRCVVGVHGRRADAIKDLKAQLQILERMTSESGPYMAGAGVSLADAACFGTFVFLHHMLPKFDLSVSDVIGPNVRVTRRSATVIYHICDDANAEQL